MSELQGQTLENSTKELAQRLNDQIATVLTGTTTRDEDHGIAAGLF